MPFSSTSGVSSKSGWLVAASASVPLSAVKPTVDAFSETGQT
ncbi:hypothetical protein [Catenuloplanes niger]